MFKELKENNKGFTLIELLVVILIIGILAGVLIAVIDPQKQQDRARDAGIKATLNKTALATEGYIAAYGDVPNGAEFLDGLTNATATDPTTDCQTSDTDCLFDVTSNDLPTATCTAGYEKGTAAGDDCHYYYVGDATTNTFQIFAASFGISGSTFMFDSSLGEIVECPDTQYSNCP